VLPAILLTLVACTQIGAALGGDLSPWKGGGFGMFATLDGTAARFVRLVVEAPGRSEELEMRPSFEHLAARAQLFPSSARLTRLAQTVAAREARHDRPVETVKVQVWRIDYDSSMRARERLLREVTVRVAEIEPRRP
jgi:hypothetical protein